MDLNKDQIYNIDFEIHDSCGLLHKPKDDISLISNKFESGGEIDFNGNYFFNDKESVQWFHEHKVAICIFVDDVSLLHTIGETFVHTFEATRNR